MQAKMGIEMSEFKILWVLEGRKSINRERKKISYFNRKVVVFKKRADLLKLMTINSDKAKKLNNKRERANLSSIISQQLIKSISSKHTIYI